MCGGPGRTWTSDLRRVRAPSFGPFQVNQLDYGPIQLNGKPTPLYLLYHFTASSLRNIYEKSISPSPLGGCCQKQEYKARFI